MISLYDILYNIVPIFFIFILPASILISIVVIVYWSIIEKKNDNKRKKGIKEWVCHKCNKSVFADEIKKECKTYYEWSNKMIDNHELLCSDCYKRMWYTHFRVVECFNCKKAFPRCDVRPWYKRYFVQSEIDEYLNRWNAENAKLHCRNCIIECSK